MRQDYKRRIHERLRGKPHLLPLFSNVHRIPERLREYDPSIFVVFNSKKQKYEVHSLKNIGNTFAYIIPYRELDARAIEFYHMTNLRTRGEKIFREIEENNEKVAKQNERAKNNEREAILKDIVYPRFRKMAWENT